MPVLIDYSGRIELIRETTLQLFLEHGPAALTMPRVAEAMGLSVSTLKRTIIGAEALPRLLLDYVQRELRCRLVEPVRWGRLPDDPPWELELRRLRWHVPVAELDRDLFRAWDAVTRAYANVLEKTEECVRSRGDLLDYAVAQVLEALPPGSLSTAERDRWRVRLPALVDGLRLAVCEGRLEGPAARAVLDEVVAELTGEVTRDGPDREDVPEAPDPSPPATRTAGRSS